MQSIYMQADTFNSDTIVKRVKLWPTIQYMRNKNTFLVTLFPQPPLKQQPSMTPQPSSVRPATTQPSSMC